VQHEPHLVGLVQARFDEMVARPQCAQVREVIRLAHGRVLCRHGLEARLQRRPRRLRLRGRVLPRAVVTAARRTAVRHRALDGHAHLAEVLRICASAASLS
jgi:hypothetical protein